MKQNNEIRKKWAVGDLLSTSTAYWRGCALQAGMRLDIFTLIHNRCMPLIEIRVSGAVFPEYAGQQSCR
ncbi:MAG: hypothetical protein U9R57_05700 [Thermodesulfobacteriota bacterium]|nr:hypothetical protein [Thermodesulfobacteriota bacterium]